MNDIYEEKDKLTTEEDVVRRRPKVYVEEDIEGEYYPRIFYAGFFIRFFSFLVDSFVVGVISKILVDSVLVAGGFDVSVKVYGLLSTLVMLLYFTIMTYVTNGQTLGKMIFSLRVVSLDGKRLDLTTVIIREFVGRFIHSYGILILLYVLTAFTERKQNLSDLLADTSVIDLSKETAYNLGQMKREEVTI